MGEVFSFYYEWLVGPPDALLLGRRRKRLIREAQGVTLEIGAGTGWNLSHYPPDVRPVLTEPARSMYLRARARQGRLGLAHPLLAADAQALPFRPATFDTVVATLVLCSVPDPALGLREAARVLKPGGRLLLLEHVLMPSRIGAALQRAVNPLWRRFTAGCSLTRETLASVQAAGFAVDDVRRGWLGYLMEIRATKPTR